MPVTNVRSEWESGNLVFKDVNGSHVQTMHSDVDAGGEVVRTKRSRFTIAQVNAGVELLPAVAGYKYRLVDSIVIAIGGAVGATTTIDILATLSSSRKLVAHAQASLAQSAALRAGGSGAAVLADGASFTSNDANTAVTVGKTGSAATTATHIDVIISYVLEKA